MVSSLEIAVPDYAPDRHSQSREDYGAISERFDYAVWYPDDALPGMQSVHHRPGKVDRYRPSISDQEFQTRRIAAVAELGAMGFQPEVDLLGIRTEIQPSRARPGHTNYTMSTPSISELKQRLDNRLPADSRARLRPVISDVGQYNIPKLLEATQDGLLLIAAAGDTVEQRGLRFHDIIDHALAAEIITDEMTEMIMHEAARLLGSNVASSEIDRFARCYERLLRPDSLIRALEGNTLERQWWRIFTNRDRGTVDGLLNRLHAKARSRSMVRAAGNLAAA